MTGSILAWHFVGDTLRDGRPVPAAAARERFNLLVAQEFGE
jgi:hypothetical protein